MLTGEAAGYAEPRSEGDADLRQYLATYAKLFEMNGIEAPELHARLAAEGRFFTPQTLPKRYKLGKPKNCFEDAARLAMASHGRLTYCEGIAMSIIPVHHAWCVDRKGRVVDKTWAAVDAEMDTDRSRLAYFGVAIDIDDLRVRLLQNRTWGFFP